MYTVFVRALENDEPGLYRIAGWDPTRRMRAPRTSDDVE
jgi:hypothetical protein